MMFFKDAGDGMGKIVSASHSSIQKNLMASSTPSNLTAHTYTGRDSN
jgi:hypothetical protein